MATTGDFLVHLTECNPFPVAALVILLCAVRVPQAKGELRTAHFEIDGLKQENAGLAQALTTKAKEMRLQVLQVDARFSFKRPHGRPQFCITSASRVVYL